MPQPAFKQAEPLELHLPAAAPAQPSIVAIDGATAEWAESPARILHERLVQSFGAPMADDPQLLPAPVRLAILMGSAATLWAAIGGIAYLLA